MRWDGFGGTLLFGALAAASVLVAAALGLSGGLFALQLLVIACLYAVGLAVPNARGARVALPAALLAGGLWLVTSSVLQAALGAALLVAVVRSVLVYRAPRLRALVAEVVLLGGGLALARGLLGPTPGSWALAVWGFFLVQSVYFWLPGLAEAVPARAPEDAFVQARRRLLRLLEDGERAR